MVDCKQVKLLMVGDYHYQIYEKYLVKRLREYGASVFEFNYGRYFDLSNNIDKVQWRLKAGPLVSKVNKRLVKAVAEENLTHIFMYRGEVVYPETLKKLKVLRPEVIIIGYNNDDPFSDEYNSMKWRHHINSIKYFDKCFAYRGKNIKDYGRMGCRDVSMLRSYYIKELNFSISGVDKEYDVVFIGHWEDDGRDDYMVHLIENNIKVKIYGTQWERSLRFEEISESVGVIRSLESDEYNRVLNQAKIALVFLSKKNNDTYTRRCFEIPVTKAFMLYEYSEDLVNMYPPGEYGEYFKTKEELLSKVSYYLNEETMRESISSKACEYTIKNHEVGNRAKQILEVGLLRK